MLHNISRSKDSQTMKFSQLIESNMRNILCTKRDEETSSKPISKK